MSMSTYVYGIIPPGDEHHKHRAVWQACEAAGVPIPQPTAKYFDDNGPDPVGLLVGLDKHQAVRPYSAEMADGYEVDLSKLPPGVTVIRFVCSY